jgi:arylsulfatase
MQRTILSTLVLLATLFACNTTTDTQAPTPQRPNIILIMADDVGYSDIGCYGGEIQTPNLDRLAANGLRFTQFYNTARCCPTRASLMTGLFPSQAGVGHMMNDRGNEFFAGDLSKKAVTIAEVLRGAGYATYLSGKWHLTPGGNEERLSKRDNWPRQRGFDQFFGTIHGAGSFYDPNSLTSGNELITPPTDDFYYTDAISDTAVAYIRTQPADQPFFLYMAYTAAHWPLHALPEDIGKYKGRYEAGWDELRRERYQRMVDMGLIKPEWKMSEAFPEGRPWEAEERKAWHADCMEVYAAMLDNMDQGIGRVIAALEEKGQLENTLILYLQDNGACAEEFGLGRNQQNPETDDWQPMTEGELQFDMVPKVTRDGRPLRLGVGVPPGPADTYIAYDERWANASNTPFRMFKHWVHEGGISSPLVVHWPAGFEGKNEFRQEPSHLVDIMATCVDVAGAQYPTEYNGNQIRPMEGKSLAPLFRNEPFEREALYWEHEGNRAVRMGRWKLVSKAMPFAAYDSLDVLPLSEWALYDMEADRTETNDVAGEHPEIVEKMAGMWENWGRRTGVVPRPPQLLRAGRAFRAPRIK